MARTLPFDRVVVNVSVGVEATYSANEFLALPLPERIQYILGGKLDFYRGEVRIPRAEALKLFRDFTNASS